jgi:hypothetical protein
MRGNWIFIAFDDCHFSNKSSNQREKKRRKLDLGSLALIKREFHYSFCRRRIAPEIK